MEQKLGKVYLVGAGPGDAELLTLKARRLMKEADVIVYDQLVGTAVLSMMPDHCEKINVGKKAGYHIKSQETINQILCEQALQGKMVVRLKGGDPFVFGRGGEELELLAEHGIPYEIVPGVTSAVAVPAYCGIPVTHRDCASSLHIITGHKRAGESYELPFSAYVQAGGTLVFLMGLHALPEIVSGLKKAGMESTMPAAVLHRGTCAEQKKVVSDLCHIVDEVEKENIQTPAIIVVGDVCTLAKQYEWYEKLPLFGNRYYVTRPRERESRLTESLRRLGAEVVEFPSIKTIECPLDADMEQIYRSLERYQYLLFTSPYGVKVFLNHLRKLRIDIRKIGSTKIGAIGTATKKAMEDAGIFVDYVPEVYSGAELGRLIGNICEDGDKILIPRSAIGTPDVIREILKCKEVEITDFSIYDTEYVNHSVIEMREEHPMVFFTSASTVKGFVSAMPEYPYENIAALCIGEQTAKEAKKYGMCAYVSKEATMDSLIELAMEMKHI